VFVGRDTELTVVDECIASVTGGTPRAVLCVGAAGMGKTRLAEEALARAAEQGVLGVWGVAEDTTGAPPFWPWIRAVRGLSRRIDLAPAAVELGASGELARLVPEVFTPSARAPRAAVADDERFQQFDALARLLRWACTVTPVAIVIDDAHWADEASLLALEHIVGGLVDERLLLWVNMRDSPGAAQTRVFERWERRTHARRVTLRGLSDDAIRAQLVALTESQVTASDVAAARVTTGGNPFFVAVVARALRERAGGRAIAGRPVVEALDARLGRLSAMSATVVRAAAILGEEFDTALVAAVSGLSALDCVAWLAEAQQSRLVRAASSPGRHRFEHALIRDAVLGGMDARERIQLHRRAAEAIEQRHGATLGSEVFAVAAHWVEAAAGGDEDTAAVWLERAAHAAMRLLAYEQADHLYAESLRVGARALSDETRCRLQLSRVRAAAKHGALSTAHKATLEAAAIARALGRVDLLAESALAMEPVGMAVYDVSIRRLCQEALAALDDSVSALRASLLARFAETYIYLPDPEAAREASVEALRTAEASGHGAALAAALRARQVVIADPEGLDERQRLMERVIELGQRGAEPALELRGRLGMVDVSFERGDLGRVAHEVRMAAQCAKQAGGPLARFWVLQVEAVLAQAQGRFAECRDRVDHAFRLLSGTDHPEAELMRAAVLSAVGRHAGHDDDVLVATGVEPGLHSPDNERMAAPGLIASVSLAATLASAGRLDAAAATFASLGPPRAWRPPPHVVLLVYALGLESAIALGREDDVAALVERLEPYRGHHVACGLVAASFAGPVEMWLGKGERHLGRLDAAVADLEDALRRCVASGAAAFAVESRVELAAALIARGEPRDRARVAAMLSDAGADAARLGMPPWAARIAELASARAGRDGALTRREREIADLVAQGLTNRQIAKRLFLSERTAQNHVQHILDKLGLDNRSQVAVWVERSRPPATPELSSRRSNPADDGARPHR
jgi:DNA-binding CsgD family transcriptional regulator/tetratricopeptide (TPR) repeat protein